MWFVEQERQSAVSLATHAFRSRRLRIWAMCVLGVVGLLGIEAFFPGHGCMPKFALPLSATTTLMVFLAALGCEYIDSTLGMGYGTTLTPLLLLSGFEPMQIVPAVLLSEFLSGLTAGVLHHRDGNVDFLRDRRAQWTAGLLTVLSVCGVLAGVTLALRISKFWLTAIIASIVLSVGVLILATVRQKLRYRAWHIVVLGGVAAFNKSLSGGGYGPLVTGGQVVSGVSGKNAVAITSLAESFTCLVGLTTYMLTSGSLYWPLAVPLVAGALFSVPIATLTVRGIPETFVRGGVGVATCILGSLMFIKLLG